MPDGRPGARRIFRSIRAPGRARHLEAVVNADGGIRITGQDVGNGVGEGDEYASYEWSWIVQPADVPAALEVLGGRRADDPHDVLEAWMSANLRDPGMAISAAGVPVEFSSRLED